MNHARCSFLGKNIKYNIIFIEDRDGPKSITNDAEHIFHTVRKAYGIDARVVYKDTEGEWWEIVQEYEQSALYTNFADIVFKFKRWHGLEWDILNR